MNTRTLGNAGEDYVTRTLASQGVNIVERNVRSLYGEIDIIGRDGETWAFVEVKTRRGSAKGAPEDSITPTKRQRMARCAQHYLAEHAREDDDWRLDVVAVTLAHDGRLISVNHYVGIGMDD